MLNTFTFILKFLIAGIIWFYLFSFTIAEKSLFQYLRTFKSQSETVTKIESNIQHRADKIIEKLGFSVPGGSDKLKEKL